MSFLTSLAVGAKDAFDTAIFTGIIKPIFSLALFLGKERVPTYVLQLVALLVALGGVLRPPLGLSTLEFFKQNVPLTPRSDLRPSYDFIVVGGGITGCLVAKRLAKAGHATLLIHGPGTVPNELTRVPLLNFGNQGNPEHDFGYKGPAQEGPHWDKGTLLYNSGKDLGGSQVLSAQMWSYGKSGDFRCWKEKFGISDKFTQEKIRAYGKIHENAEEAIKGADFPYGTEGEIGLSYSPTWSPFTERFADRFERTAANVTGTRVNADQNSDALGFGKIIHAVESDTGFISTPSRAFFEKDFPENLHILTQHMVRKILFDTSVSPPRAYGVEFVGAEDKLGLAKLTKNATKRVILTAGAIRTPQLLTLSGVGSKADLQKWKITPVATRDGVGQNLHDHYDIGNAAVCFDEGQKHFKEVTVEQLVEFATERKGQLRAALGTQSYGFFTSKQSNLTTCPDPDDAENCRPDFELILQNVGQNTQVVAKHYYSCGITTENLERDYYLEGRNRTTEKGFFNINFNQKDCLMVTPTLLHPEYRGQITLTSSDPLDDPIIDLKTTSNSRDMILIGELWQQVKEILNESFKDITGKFDDTPFPECEDIEDKYSFEFGECQVKAYLKSAWHMGGSCRIGREDDPLACVDENFHVIGVQNLVVADASTLPCPTSGHMLPTIAALAEMAAEELINKFKK